MRRLEKLELKNQHVAEAWQIKNVCLDEFGEGQREVGAALLRVHHREQSQIQNRDDDLRRRLCP
jgi:hypothetical protein